jgi:CO dehydrogenase/acetyl-CoA synthase gamma subunit (corrinoid Fe-S protein)
MTAATGKNPCSPTGCSTCNTGIQNSSHQCSCSTDTCGKSEILRTDSIIRQTDHLDHLLARLGVNRMGHRVKPGIYRIGNPTEESPVFASANYTLSFDALRGSLAGIDGFILVLDTKGINVWCAAGKGTFGTDELVNRIVSSGLASVVCHRRIIVPQLGAPGIASHEVQRRTGFRVDYGPVRAADLPEYLSNAKASPEMRRVSFPLHDRLVLAPVELVHVALPAIIIATALWFLAGQIASIAAVAAVLTGTVVFPALLPYLPTRDYSTKGLILGGVVAIPFSFVYPGYPGLPGWAGILSALAPLLIIPAVTAYLALNFTGSTPYPSRTGVKKRSSVMSR